MVDFKLRGLLQAWLPVLVLPVLLHSNQAAVSWEMK